MDRDQLFRKRQGARLKAARIEAGYRSARAAAEESGWPESTYRAHEAGTRTIGLDDAERYARRYRTEGVRVSAKSILFDSETRMRPEADSPVSMAPRLSWVAASKMADVGDVPHPSDAPGVPISDLPPGDWFALKVRGDSMDLIAPDGATILINRADKRLVRNKFYVFSNGGEATFKRFVDKPVKRLEPFSSNRSHEPIYPGRDFAVVGRVHRVIVDL
jgi:phage repressor protein C with HTH and peptisase S24 domain